jgi:hypothetical protein
MPVRGIKGEFVPSLDNIVICPTAFMWLSLFKKPTAASVIATSRVPAFKQRQRCDIRAACPFGGQHCPVNTPQVKSDEVACGFLVLSVKHLNRNGSFQTGDKVGQGKRFVTTPDAVRYSFTIGPCDILMLDIE